MKDKICHALINENNNLNEISVIGNEKIMSVAVKKPFIFELIPLGNGRLTSKIYREKVIFILLVFVFQNIFVWLDC
jgi:hypothetical protein